MYKAEENDCISLQTSDTRIYTISFSYNFIGFILPLIEMCFLDYGLFLLIIF